MLLFPAPDLHIRILKNSASGGSLYMISSRWTQHAALDLSFPIQEDALQDIYLFYWDCQDEESNPQSDYVFDDWWSHFVGFWGVLWFW